MTELISREHAIYIMEQYLSSIPEAIEILENKELNPTIMTFDVTENGETNDVSV